MRIPDAVRALERDLRDVFGERLHSLVVYAGVDAGDKAATMAVVDRLAADDLRACAARVGTWQDAGLATPLFLAAHEFARSLDVFPFEFGAILAEHHVVAGRDPFDGLHVDPAHLRHACEVQARSHLLHLREGFLETAGRGDRIADLLARSATPLAALLVSVARLHGHAVADRVSAASIVERAAGLPMGVLRTIVELTADRSVPSEEARRLFPGYLEAVEQLAGYVDRWGPHAQ
jgi:hypothetical protein